MLLSGGLGAMFLCDDKGWRCGFVNSVKCSGALASPNSGQLLFPVQIPKQRHSSFDLF